MWVCGIIKLVVEIFPERRQCMTNIVYPEKVKKIFEIFKKYGYDAYAVGGCVRDSLMGKSPADWDITTSAPPEKTLEIFELENIRTLPTGLKHGTVSVLLDGEIFECTTFRIDGDYKDSRHPESVSFTDKLELDLSRRDFTVNAMAASDTRGVCDFFGGRDDLKKGIIRCVGQPHMRFSEDALRILRGVRFATVLDFDIEAETLCAIKDLSHTLSDISAERKTVEFSKILCSEHANKGAKLLFETGVIYELLPDTKTAPTDMTLLDGEPSLRLATFMYQSSARDLSRLRLSNIQKKNISILLTPIVFDNTDEGARRTLAKYGELAVPACKLQGRAELLRLVEQQKAKNPALSISQLEIDGNTLLSLGISPENIGKILSSLLDRVLCNPELNNKNTLIEAAKKLGA